MVKNVIITGATGLLGRAVFKRFNLNGAFNTLGFGFSRAGDGIKRVDLTNKQMTIDVINEFKVNLFVVFIVYYF